MKMVGAREQEKPTAISVMKKKMEINVRASLSLPSTIKPIYTIVVTFQLSQPKIGYI